MRKKHRAKGSLLPPPLPVPLPQESPLPLPLATADDLKAIVQSVVCPGTPRPLKMTSKGLEEFLSSLKEYYNKDALSDVTITCDGQEFKAHRVIISAHSKCFAKALNGDWKESSERQIDIKDFDASVVEAMLRFMYSFDYSNIYGTSTMVFDAQMYQIADKYDIPALKAQSKKKFNVAVTTGWSMDDFPLAITVVYESKEHRQASWA